MIKEIHLAGVTFEGRQKILKELYEKNSPFNIVLVSEPDNPYDEHAVKIVANGSSEVILVADTPILGYIPKEYNRSIKPENSKILNYSLTKHPEKDIVGMKLLIQYEDDTPYVQPNDIQ